MRIPQPHPRRASRRGSTLLFSLFIVVFVAGLILAFLQMGVSFNREQGARVEDEHAIFIAEAGLAEALVALRNGESGAIASQAAPATYADNGLVWVERADIGNDVMQLTSSAMTARGRASLELLVFHFMPQTFRAALFSDESLTLESNVMVDSFDSGGGPYNVQLAAGGGAFVSDGAIVQSNGDITLNSTVSVYGDVHPGPDGSVTYPGNSTISNTTQPMPEPRVMDPITVPVFPPAGDFLVPGATVATLPSGDYNFGRLAIANDSQLTITGPARIVVDDFGILSNSHLILDTLSGRVELYVADQAELRSNSTITTTSFSALDCAFYFTGGPTQNVLLRSNAEFYGTIYAPEGSVEIRSNFEVFGAVMADRITLNSNTQVHFDEALLGGGPGPEVFISSAWNPVGFPIQQLMTDRRDAALVLGLNRAALPMLANAHVP